MASGIQLGEIYIVRVPFVGSGGSKPRPVLITGLPNSKGDVLGIPGSSRLAQWREPQQVVVEPVDLASGTLAVATVFPASKSMVFSPNVLAARWPLPEAITRIVAWHKALRAGADMRAYSLAEIAGYRANPGD